MGRDMKTDHDAYGREIYAAYQGEGFLEITERDDGFVGGMDGNIYFAGFEDWPEHEKKSIALAAGRILDIGSGAGRVSLYLQEKGHDVLAIDNSPLALKVCQLRGVRNTRLMSITRLGIGARIGFFDTVVMFGNKALACSEASSAPDGCSGDLIPSQGQTRSFSPRPSIPIKPPNPITLHIIGSIEAEDRMGGQFACAFSFASTGHPGLTTCSCPRKNSANTKGYWLETPRGYSVGWSYLRCRDRKAAAVEDL